MAEAAVEERPMARFYCHMCNVEFQNAANNYTCPHCSDGFIEELQENRMDESAPGPGSFVTVPWDSEMDDVGLFGNPSLRLGSRGPENSSPMEGRTLTRLASSNLRAFHPPIDHLVHDFIINLGVNLGGQGNVQLFLGNPGDYAWGREGLDAIVTQLLNQMDTSGPPPVSKAVIDSLQVVEVNDEQVGQNLQCSVCWEHFQLKEQVRQLPCLHIYHEPCIRPWLELHGTCPICRQNLGEEEDGNNSQSNGDPTGVEAAASQAENVQSVLRSIFGPAATSTTYQSESSSDSLGQQGGQGSGGV